MPDTARPIRIAIILDGQEFTCREELLPFSLEGYPPLDLILYASHPEAQPEEDVHPLSELDRERVDLILDSQFLAAGRPDFFPEKTDNLVAGPAAAFLKDLLCQLEVLREKLEINTGVINSATDALVTINEDHIIVGYNEEAERLFGYSREEALGRDLKLIVPPPFKDIHGDFLRRYLATREPHVLGRQRRIPALRRTGEELTLSISFSVAEIQDKLYFTAIMRDITDYKAMEDRVLQSARLAAVGNTVTHIAHEIKNPLLIIGGFARQLLNTPGLDDKSRSQLSTIAAEVKRLEEMVAEMRDFVRRPPVQKEQGQVAAAIQKALALFEDFFRERHIEVRVVEEAPLPAVTFDPRQVHEVLTNLFKNGLEAMPEGGVLTVASRVRDDQVEISVSDTGEGMTPEVVARIFQPFFTTKEKGTGLGLAICQSIVQEHGGCLLAESAPGKGSTFTIQLPVESAPEEEPTPQT